MKIAVIFSTQLRTIEYTTPNLLKFFGELFPQIDFFCHTWDISYHSTKQSGIIRHDNPNETIIEDYNKLINDPKIVADFIKIFNPKKMVIENFLEYQKKNYFLNENDFQMWYSIWAGNELKKQYEIENIPLGTTLKGGGKVFAILKIDNVKLLIKEGGKSGLWKNPDGLPNFLKEIF